MGSPLRSNGRGPSARPALSPAPRPTKADVHKLFRRFDLIAHKVEKLTPDEFETAFEEVPFDEWDGPTDVPFEFLFPPDLQPEDLVAPDRPSVPARVASSWAWSEGVRRDGHGNGNDRGKGVAR